MDTSIITGLFTLGGVIVGAVSSFFIARMGNRIKDKDIALKEFSRQLIAYWHLEKEHVSTIASFSNQSESSVMNKGRTSVVNQGYERPTMTENEVKKRMKELRLS